MAHHKRRRRRRGDIKGHCGLCMLRKTDGTRSGRRLTIQEQASLLTLVEGLDETSERPRLTVCRASVRPPRGMP